MIQMENVTYAYEKGYGVKNVNFTIDDAELLVHTYVADGNGNLKGDGISPNPQGVKYAVVTAEDAEDVADEARDTYAIPAKQATDALVGTTTDNGQTWTLRGDGISPNPQGVAYAVGKADDALANSRLADGATPASPSGGYTSAIYLADQADTNSTSALDNSRISTGGTPAGPSGGYTSAIYLADQADTNATDAVSTANAAQANSRIADGATPAAPSGGYTSAIYLADAALDNSRESDGSGGYNSAISIANNAERATDRLVATTADDGLTWTLTGGNTNASTDPKGVKYAVETAEAAQSAVAASGLYTIVANFAALPALTDASLDNDNQNSLLYQISDSTDIEDESTLNGEPAGFTGDDELTVKLKANITASPKRWDWQEYYATDPETRYRKKLIVENLITISETYTIGTGNNAHSVGPVTISHNGTDLTYNAENHAQPYVATNAATAGNTVTIPENSTWLIN